jgi:hypothetical protein
VATPLQLDQHGGIGQLRGSAPLSTRQHWQQLTWDSGFFGLPIGRIDLDGAEPTALADAEADARAAGLVCLYGELDPAHLDRIDVVQRAGYRLMDVALDLEHPTSLLVDPPPTTSTVRVGTPADLPALADQIAVVAPWSRFTVDPRFGESAARALHQAWVERAAREEAGRLLLVAEDDRGITGMSTLQRPAATTAVDERPVAPRIDLIASTRNSSGAAQALVGHAFACFGPGRSEGGPIAARNTISLRFSEQMGYRISRARYLFHRWLDEPVATEVD